DRVKFRPSTVSGREGRLYYQIIHERMTRQLLTDYRIFPTEWDDTHSSVVSGKGGTRYNELLSIKERIKSDTDRLFRIIRSLDSKKTPYTTDKIIEEFSRTSSDNTLFNFMENLISRLKELGRLRTSDTYKSTLSSFKKFRNDEDILLECVTADTMESYQGWLQQKGAAPNTVSFYIRVLRAVYNRAVDNDLTENRRPFRHVYTGVDKTVKRALPLRIIKKIKNLDLSYKPELGYARDMFMLSFMFRGMSFIDMAYLKKTDLRNGYVTYRRRKTRQQLTIAWTREMQEIVERYPENKSDYLLPIIRKGNTNERFVAKNVSERINNGLKKIGGMINLTIPLTMYVARHSWASVAKSKGVPLSVISEGLGHEKASTTRIYLAQLDSKVI
ncbi:MAG: site-specific integrase, partial [Muribaculaceae bacterium]|nr:site-specific integrase [Muribaculaceae bacterium]